MPFSAVILLSAMLAAGDTPPTPDSLARPMAGSGPAQVGAMRPSKLTAAPTAPFAESPPTPTPAVRPPAGADDAKLSLPPPSSSDLYADQSDDPPSAVQTVVTTLSSLAIVLGLFFLLAWFTRRNSSRGAGALPTEVVEVLGRSPLAPKQNMHLVRIGGKLLLLSVTAAGAETLTEITDPVEVDRLAGLCRQGQSNSVTATFRQVLSQLDTRPSSKTTTPSTA